jgi:hypothetical protein
MYRVYDDLSGRRIIGRLIPTALSVKNEREYRAPGWDVQVRDFVNNPFLKGEVRIFGAGFSEELPSLVRCNLAPPSPAPPYQAMVDAGDHEPECWCEPAV